jgi:hypothetical protein
VDTAVAAVEGVVMREKVPAAHGVQARSAVAVAGAL